MAFIFADSFDHFNILGVHQKWTEVVPASDSGGDSTSIDTGFGRRSTQGYNIKYGNQNNYSPSIRKLVTPGDSTIVVGLAFKSNSAFSDLGAIAGENQAANLLRIRVGGVNQLHFTINSSGYLEARLGGGTTILGTASMKLVQGIFYSIQVKAVISSSGSLEVRYNNIPVIALSGIATENLPGGWDEFTLGHVYNADNSSTVDWAYDDVYLLDGTGSSPWNDFLGDVNVDSLFPASPGNKTEWTPVPDESPNWSNIDEMIGNNEEDYNTTPDVDAIDTFVLQPFTRSSTIFAVQHCLLMRKMDSEDYTVAPVIRHGTTDYVGDDPFPVDEDDFIYRCRVYEKHPTDVPWTAENVNTSEFGYKRVT